MAMQNASSPGVPAPQTPSASCPSRVSDITVADGGNRLLAGLWRSPDKCHQIGALDRSTKRFKNLVVSNLSTGLQGAIALSKARTDAYLACAEYIGPDGRTAANASGAWAFWMDLDCGESKAEQGKGFATCDKALLALSQFCNDTKLPPPTHIVNSGGGLHVYWVFDEFLERETWQEFARKLKALTLTLGFLADPTRTADIASVLRIPGTQNYKYSPPKPVVLMYAAAAFIQTSAMLDAISNAHASLCQTTEPKRVTCAAHTNTHQTATPGQRPRSATASGIHLSLLRSVLEHLDADCGYGDWFRVAAAVFHETGGSNDGFNLFDEWSRTGEKYRGSRETMSKWTSLSPDHPTPVTIATLRRMVEANAHDWLEVCMAAEDNFEPCETEVIEPGQAPVGAHLMGRGA